MLDKVIELTGEELRLAVGGQSLERPQLSVVVENVGHRGGVLLWKGGTGRHYISFSAL